MHSWYDDDADEIDWRGIGDAAAYIGEGLRRWGRVDVRQYKEKFGTARVYCDFGIHWWPQFSHPGYVWNPFPKWTWRWQHSPRWIFSVINFFIVPLHVELYREYYRRAILRWPHLEKEILSGSDFPELLGARIIDHQVTWWWHKVDQCTHTSTENHNCGRP